MILQNARYAVRMLRKTPAFTAIVALSLALGIGANTALFSLVDDLLIRSLPVRQPDGLVFVTQTFVGMGIRKSADALPKPVFDAVREHNTIFSEIVGFARLNRPIVEIDGVSESNRQVEEISANFFRDLGVTPSVGRGPEAADSTVAVVSDGLWRARFGADPRVLGRTLTVEQQQYTIVGVAPPRFAGLSFDTPADIWISARADAALQMIARLKPGVSPGQGQAAMQVLFRQIAQAHPDVAEWDEERMRAELRPAGKGLSQIRGQYRGPLLALSVLVTLVLLITCTNVANLLTLRNAARRRELSVRAALGAGRTTLLATALIESLVLAALGGGLGVAFAKWGVAIILSMLPLAMVPQTLTFDIDSRLLAFASGVSLASALLFGLVPAWRATGGDVTTGLRSSHSNTPTRSMRRLGRTLVACQVGLSVVLLVGAGLFVQTLRNLAHIDVGFNPDGLLQVLIDTPGAGYREGQVTPLYSLLVERLSAIPGVQIVSGIRNPVMRSGLSRTSFRMLGPNRPLGPNDIWDSADVGPSFFEAMNIPLVRGRTFTAADFQAGRAVVVISEAFARHYFPNEDPTVGKVGEVIVGVVKDAKLPTIRTEPGPMMYMLMRPKTNRLGALEVRISGSPDAIVPRIQEEIRRVNPRLLLGINPMRQEIDRTVASERMVGAISGFFGVLGLLLASIGIFGVASSTVAQRTNELGIRMALGADRWSIIRESLRDTTLVFGAGLAAGVVAAVAAVRASAHVISDLLFGLTAVDTANVVGAGVLMIAVALAACVLPARRATRIDPLAAIRHE